MKIFIAYRFTGEDPEKLKPILDNICSSLTKAGFTNYCSINSENAFRRDHYTVKQIMADALKELDQCDGLLAFVNSNNKSEGMLIEAGYAVAKGKPVILAKRKDIPAGSLEGVASKVIEFSDLPELYDKLNKLKI